MKKTGAILTLLVISILLISISLASANILTDIWNKITGRVVEEDCSNDIDDDEDSLTDCEDRDCDSASYCELELHYVKIQGDNLIVSYSKHFDTCAHLKDENYNILHTENVFCASGDNIEVIQPLSKFTVESAQRVRVCHGNWGSKLESNLVTVTTEEEKSITVTSPDGGEVWVKGSTYDITWESTGYEKVVIDVSSNIGQAYSLAGVTSSDIISASSGEWSWTVGSVHPNIPLREDYVIRVFPCCPFAPSGGWEEGVNYDKSDNYFSIAGTVTCTDSDGGLNYQIKGTLTNSSGTYEDYCDGNSIVEHYCEGIDVKDCNQWIVGYTCVDLIKHLEGLFEPWILDV